MTTPKDTWISVNDAMPPKENEISSDCDLIVRDDTNHIFHVQYYEPTRQFLTLDDYPIQDVVYFMLLSKPKTK